VRNKDRKLGRVGDRPCRLCVERMPANQFLRCLKNDGKACLDGRKSNTVVVATDLALSQLKHGKTWKKGKREKGARLDFC
jgi:hypothetical protein